MEYMDWVGLGQNKRARKMTRQDVAEAMASKAKALLLQDLKGVAIQQTRPLMMYLKCSPQSIGKLSSSIATGRS